MTKRFFCNWRILSLVSVPAKWWRRNAAVSPDKRERGGGGEGNGSSGKRDERGTNFPPRFEFPYLEGAYSDLALAREKRKMELNDDVFRGWENESRVFAYQPWA